MAEEVRADLLLGRDTLSPGLVKAGRAASDASSNIRQLTRDLYEAGKVRATPVVDLQDAAATAKLDDVSQKLRDLGAKVADPQINVEDKAAVAEVTAMQVKFDRLNRLVASPRITLEGLARAEAGVAALDLELDKLDRKRVTVTVSERLSKLSAASFLQPSPLAATLPGLGPTLIPIAGQLAGAVGLVTASFGAAAVGAAGFGATAASVLSQASTDFTKLQQLNLTLNAATTKSAKDAARAQIAALQQGWTPAFRQVMANLNTLQERWKATSIQIAAPAVATWLDVVTKALTFLKPLLTPVADLFQAWGQSLDRYFSSSAGAAKIRDIATAVGQFAAIQLADIVNFFKDMITGVVNLGRDIGAAGVQYGALGGYLSQWGQAFASWSKSKAARQDVSAFVHYIRDNGHLLAGVVKDLAKYIPGIFAGATAAGTLELKTLSTFLGWVAKLPPSWAKPLTEVTGALLLLAKTGVLKIGIQVVGVAAKWLSGGTLSLAGSSAAAEMETAMRAGGAAAAAEIRGAFTGGGAVSGGEGAAGTAAAGGAGATATSIGKGLVRGGVGLIITDLIFRAIAAVVPKADKAAIAQVKSSTPGWAQAVENTLFGAGWVNLNSSFQKYVQDPVRKFFRNLGDTIVSDWQTMWGAIQKDNVTAGHAVEHWFGSFRHGTADVFDGLRHDIANIWDTTWNNTVGRARNGMHDAEGVFDSMRHGIANTYDGVRHDIASAWDTIWNNTIGRVRNGIADVVAWFRKLPGMVMHALLGLGTDLYNYGKNAIQMIWNGAKSLVGGITGFFSSFAHGIVGVFKKIWGWFSPSSVMYEGGRSLMEGLAKGIRAHAHKAQDAATSAASGIGGAATGPLQSYARKLLAAYGWSNQWPAFADIVARESGWNVHATNPSSGAYGIPQALPPGKMASAGADWRTSGYTQLRWMMSYIKSAWGSPNAADANERAQHWYGSGLQAGIFTRPTVIGVGERGPERVDITPVRSPRGGAPSKITWEIRTGDNSQYSNFLAGEIQKYVIIHGGDVQVALGTSA